MSEEDLFWAAVADLSIKWHNQDMDRFMADTNNGGMIIGNKQAAILRMVIARKVSEKLVKQVFEADPKYREAYNEVEDFVTDLLRINNVR